MSANDLVKREDVQEKVKSAIEVLITLGCPWEIFSPLWDALEAFNDIPAAPHEMTAREYEIGWHSLCTYYSKYLCKGCPLDDGEQCGVPTKYHRAIIEKWARENPGDGFKGEE